MTRYDLRAASKAIEGRVTDEPTEREIMDRHATFLLRAFLWGLALALVVIVLMNLGEP